MHGDKWTSYVMCESIWLEYKLKLWQNRKLLNDELGFKEKNEINGKMFGGKRFSLWTAWINTGQ